MSPIDPLYSRKRIEHDALGPMEVPFGALYGIKTARALRNVPVSGVAIGRFPELIGALALVKKAAARANARLGGLPAAKADLIGKVCDEIVAGQHLDHFRVDVLQGGAGAATNANMNEVIANRGLEMMGRANGDYARLHPDRDVNRAQSAEAVYRATIRLALLAAVPRLADALRLLAAAFEDREALVAYGAAVRDDLRRLDEAAALLCEIDFGGTESAPGHGEAVIGELAGLSSLPLAPVRAPVEPGRHIGTLTHVSSLFRRIATGLSRIADDLRPAPGKAEPAIPDMVNQVAFHAIGSDLTIAFAAEGGRARSAAFEPLIAYELLKSVALLRNAAELFRVRCVEEIGADGDWC